MVMPRSLPLPAARFNYLRFTTTATAAHMLRCAALVRAGSVRLPSHTQFTFFSTYVVVCSVLRLITRMRALPLPPYARAARARARTRAAFAARARTALDAVRCFTFLLVPRARRARSFCSSVLPTILLYRFCCLCRTLPRMDLYATTFWFIFTDVCAITPFCR